MSKLGAVETAMSKDWMFLTDNAPKIVAWAGVFLAPIKILLVNIYLLVFCDLLTGIWASWKNGEPIVSSKLRRTVSKIFAYTTAVLVVGSLEGAFVPEFAVMKVVAAYIGITEVKSIFENLHRATGHDVWEILLKKLKTVQPGKAKRKGRQK